MDIDDGNVGGCCGLKWLRNAIAKRLARLSNFLLRRRRREFHPADVTAHEGEPNGGDNISIASSVIRAIAECAVRESLFNLVPAEDGERAPADPLDTAGGKLASSSQYLNHDDRESCGIGEHWHMNFSVAHAVELGNPVPQKPILFLKPTSSYIAEGENIRIPVGCSSLHHEVELGIVIGKPGSAIQEKDAANYIGGYVLALDMTARDFQDEAKKKGQPWSLAKGFDTSCPVSNLIDKEKISNPENVRLWLKVNDALKQDGTTSDMIFSIPYLISYISRYFKLEEGDVILTGTPEGVGPVGDGDTIEAGLGDVVSMRFKVEAAK